LSGAERRTSAGPAHRRLAGAFLALHSPDLERCREAHARRTRPLRLAPALPATGPASRCGRRTGPYCRLPERSYSWKAGRCQAEVPLMTQLAGAAALWLRPLAAERFAPAVVVAVGKAVASASAMAAERAAEPAEV
jgi:hypothetical protein